VDWTICATLQYPPAAFNKPLRGRAPARLRPLLPEAVWLGDDLLADATGTLHRLSASPDAFGTPKPARMPDPAKRLNLLLTACPRLLSWPEAQGEVTRCLPAQPAPHHQKRLTLAKRSYCSGLPATACMAVHLRRGVRTARRHPHPPLLGMSSTRVLHSLCPRQRGDPVADGRVYRGKLKRHISNANLVMSVPAVPDHGRCCAC